jgi:hypothetical protein
VVAGPASLPGEEIARFAEALEHRLRGLHRRTYWDESGNVIPDPVQEMADLLADMVRDTLAEFNSERHAAE